MPSDDGVTVTLELPPVSEMTGDGGVSVAVPCVTVQVTGTPGEPPFSASSTRTVSGVADGPFTSTLWLSPEIFFNWEGGGTMWMRVESRRCVGVSTYIHTLSRIPVAPVNVPVVDVGCEILPLVVSPESRPTGTLATAEPPESTLIRRVTACPPTTVVSRGARVTLVAPAPGPTYRAARVGVAGVVLESCVVSVATYQIAFPP